MPQRVNVTDLLSMSYWTGVLYFPRLTDEGPEQKALKTLKIFYLFLFLGGKRAEKIENHIVTQLKNKEYPC